MKTRTLKKDKVNIITLGCSKNMVDSEVLSGQLLANEIDVVHESTKKDHNIVVVNTCGFIDKAKEESVNTIIEQVALKKKGGLDLSNYAAMSAGGASSASELCRIHMRRYLSVSTGLDPARRLFTGK